MAYIVMAYIVMAYVDAATATLAASAAASVAVAVAVADAVYGQRFPAPLQAGLCEIFDAERARTVLSQFDGVDDALQVCPIERPISASPTACPLRGYGRAGTQNDRLGAARPYPRNRHAVGEAEIKSRCYLSSTASTTPCRCVQSNVRSNLPPNALCSERSRCCCSRRRTRRTDASMPSCSTSKAPMSASPMALHGYRRATTQNGRFFPKSFSTVRCSRRARACTDLYLHVYTHVYAHVCTHTSVQTPVSDPTLRFF